MKMIQLKQIPDNYLEEIGFKWHKDPDGSDYVASQAVVVSQAEAEAFYEAGNELYDMFVEAGDYVIEHNLFHEIGIPFNLVELIKDSWASDVHWHLYGRFDLAGGLDGRPIKLLEFNADTPTALFETSILQWAMLKYNNLDENAQFNNVYEALKDNFQRVVTLDEYVDNFSELYEGWKMLFSSVKGNVEEENTVRLLQNAAEEAGWHTKFAYIDEVSFSDDEISFQDEVYEFWFKLIPWENIAIEEGELALLLQNIIKNQAAIILNPAYTLMFQSKGFMKILWDLYPNHPLLLETSFHRLDGKKYVEKRVFGREGESIKIFDTNDKIIEQKKGEYDGFKAIYQEFYPLNSHENEYYQAGLFFAYESCGLSFRKGGLILDNYAKFVPHVIKD